MFEIIFARKQNIWGPTAIPCTPQPLRLCLSSVFKKILFPRCKCWMWNFKQFLQFFKNVKIRKHTKQKRH